MSNPGPVRFRRLYSQGRSAGLDRDTAAAYATLAWWGEWYGLPAATIADGKRDPRRTRDLQRRWDQGDRAGLVVRPASNSKHHDGRAFDLHRVPHLWVYGAWSPAVNLEWGGTYATPDDIHFEQRG